MQNKKSVLFIEPENMLVKAKTIKKELLKQSSFAGIIIAEKKLRCLVKNLFFDKIFPEGSSIRKTYKKIHKKIFSRKQENMTYGDACGLPQKTVRNLLYRFVPDIVVVSTEEALRSILVERKKLGIKCDLCVLFGDQPEKDIIAEEVERYFVEGIDERNMLVSWGVDAEKIVQGTTLLLDKDEEEEKAIDAKRSFGITKEKAVLYCLDNCDKDFLELIRIELQKDMETDFERLFMCGKDEKAAEMVSECGERVVSGNDMEGLLLATDLVVTNDEAIKAEAEKHKKPCLDLTQESFSFEIINRALEQKMPPEPLAMPQRVYADYLVKMLEAKMNAEPIEPEEEPEEWTLQGDDDEE